MDEQKIGPLGPDGSDYVTINDMSGDIRELLDSSVKATNAVGEHLEANNRMTGFQNQLLAKQVRAFNILSFTVLVLTISVVVLIVRVSQL